MLEISLAFSTAVKLDCSRAYGASIRIPVHLNVGGAQRWHPVHTPLRENIPNKLEDTFREIDPTHAGTQGYDPAASPVSARGRNSQNSVTHRKWHFRLIISKLFQKTLNVCIFRAVGVPEEGAHQGNRISTSTAECTISSGT